MPKAGVLPGQHTIASTMDAFAAQGDVEQVLALMKVSFLLDTTHPAACFVLLRMTQDTHYLASRAVSYLQYTHYGALLTVYFHSFFRWWGKPISVGGAMRVSVLQ